MYYIYNYNFMNFLKTSERRVKNRRERIFVLSRWYYPFMRAN